MSNTTLKAVIRLPVLYNSLTPAERREVRHRYVVQQCGECYYCGRLLTGPSKYAHMRPQLDGPIFPPGFFDHPIHLHHSHKTGFTLGAVHALCNAVLFVYLGE